MRFAGVSLPMESSRGGEYRVGDGSEVWEWDFRPYPSPESEMMAPNLPPRQPQATRGNDSPLDFARAAGDGHRHVEEVVGGDFAGEGGIGGAELTRHAEHRHRS